MVPSEHGGIPRWLSGLAIAEPGPTQDVFPCRIHGRFRVPEQHVYFPAQADHAGEVFFGIFVTSLLLRLG